MKQTITKLPDTKSRSGKTIYSISVTCTCGFGTKGNNTFSMEHLEKWASEIAKWHHNKEH